MENKDVFQVLKNLSLVDLITIVAENSDIVVQEKSTNEVYYTAKELIKLYPNIFSKYKIDKYIKYDNLPYIKDGKERFFLKSQIDEWLSNKSLTAIFKGVNV